MKLTTSRAFYGRYYYAIEYDKRGRLTPANELNGTFNRFDSKTARDEWVKRDPENRETLRAIDPRVPWERFKKEFPGVTHGLTEPEKTRGVNGHVEPAVTHSLSLIIGARCTVFRAHCVPPLLPGNVRIEFRKQEPATVIGACDWTDTDERYTVDVSSTADPCEIINRAVDAAKNVRYNMRLRPVRVIFCKAPDSWNSHVSIPEHWFAEQVETKNEFTEITLKQRYD